jgi:hypothetical protein
MSAAGALLWDVPISLLFIVAVLVAAAALVRAAKAATLCGTAIKGGSP